jgi:phospholipase C
MPPNLRRALANPPKRQGSFRDIEHVVLLMQENRSFDHYFGTMAGVRGFGDPDALRLSNGRSVFYQPDPQNPDGFLLPFHLDTRVTSGQRIPSTSHAWSAQHAAWNGGMMDRWMLAHRKTNGENAPYVMSYYTRRDIPFHFALADNFTICDAYHCSVLGPTFPNRMYWMTGTIDPEGSRGGPMTDNHVPPGGFEWTTYAERLEAAGVNWKVYHQRDHTRRKHLDLNMLPNFRAFQEAEKNSPLYKKGMTYGPEGQFEYDAINDRLPAVSWIIPSASVSEHPHFIPAAGAAFIASKVDAIAANPKVWAKTLFILNYDENDGLFDHVAPPVPPFGTAQEFVDGQPIGAGFRVPCILISPWTAGGRICSERFDHTSVLQLLEKFTGVREPNISQWRRNTFDNLTAALQFDGTMTRQVTLPDTGDMLKLAKYKVGNLPNPALPGSGQSMPVQEPRG